jgi:hypothetical protein
MGYFTVTSPAFTTIRSEVVECGCLGEHFVVGDKLVVATDTVLLYDFGAGLFNHDYLRLKPEGKHGGVAQTVFGLEEVLVEYVVLRHMAIVTRCPLAMRTVKPGGILRIHHVTVDAGGWIIA